MAYAWLVATQITDHPPISDALRIRPDHQFTDLLGIRLQELPVSYRRLLCNPSKILCGLRAPTGRPVSLSSKLAPAQRLN
jgi:hypothetical protein